MDRDCDTVGWTVASQTRDLRFKTNHLQLLFNVICFVKTKIREKEFWKWPFSKLIKDISQYITDRQRPQASNSIVRGYKSFIFLCGCFSKLIGKKIRRSFNWRFCSPSFAKTIWNKSFDWTVIWAEIGLTIGVRLFSDTLASSSRLSQKFIS